MTSIVRLCFILILFTAFQGLSGQSILERTTLLYNSSQKEYTRGNFFLAKKYLDELEPLKDSLPDYPLAAIENAIGLVNWKLGNYREAKRHFDSAVQKCDGKDIPSIQLLITIYNNYGLLHNQEGDYNAAIEYYQRAEAQLNSIPTSQEYYVEMDSKLQYNAGIVYYNLGQYDEAIDCMDSALSLKKQYGLPGTGNVYFNLARCFEQTKDPQKADFYYQKSIHQWIAESDSTYFELGKAYLEYARFLSAQGKDSSAVQFFDLATENYLLNYGFFHPYTAGCYNLLADFYVKQKEYPKALDKIQLGLSSITPDFNSGSFADNPSNKESLMDLGLLKIYRSKIRALREYADAKLIGDETSAEAVALLEVAAETSKEAIQVLGRIQESYLTQESRLYLIENQKDFFIHGIGVALQLYKLTGNPDYRDLAYQFAAAGKAMDLRFEIKVKNELYLRSLQDSASLNLLKIKEDVDSYTNMIQMEQMKVDPDWTKISDWQRSRFDLRRAYESMHEQLFGREATATGSQWFEKGIIRSTGSKLRRNETLIEYSISDPGTDGSRHLYAFVITHKEGRVYQTLLPRSFNDQIELVEDHLYNFHSASLEKEHLSGLQESLHRLYEELIEPVEAWFAGTRLIIIPDGALVTIPFDALIRAQPKEQDLYSSSSYLVRDFSTSYLPVSSFLQKPGHRMVRKTPRVSLLAQDYSINGGDSIGTLTGVQQEVAAVQKLMKTRLLGKEGSKERLKTEIEQTSLLHFALHSYPSSEEQDASYLLLNSQSDSAHNNLLFDFEIEPLNLSCEMVVMNVCESGGGKQIDGEGMMSFSRSFMLAGARSVIHSLWPVDDRSGSTIMIQFYRDLLKGKNKPEALREAKINYLEQSSPTFTHPYFWAGQQVIGETGPVATPYTRTGIPVAGLLLLGIWVWRRRQPIHREKG